MHIVNYTVLAPLPDCLTPAKHEVGATNSRTNSFHYLVNAARVTKRDRGSEHMVEICSLRAMVRLMSKLLMTSGTDGTTLNRPLNLHVGARTCRCE